MRAEEERFRETLERGLREFEELAGAEAISGEDAFRLAATYGFPIELTVELAEERGQAVDVDGYRRAMAEHREISRAGAAFDASGGRAGGRPPTEFVGYERRTCSRRSAAFDDVGDGRFEAKLERSPFYAEGGGQVSDTGWIEHEETGRAPSLVRADRIGDDQVLTFRGDGFAAGDRVRAVVPWKVRFPTMANHTATHLLHKALQEVLGDHVRQAGSAVRPDKLRFDFTHGARSRPEEREAVERRVNEKVFENVRLSIYETTLEEARKLGAMMLFGEKYGDVVRVVEIPGYSRELCGGTHVRTTAEIGPFAILSEGRSARACGASRRSPPARRTRCCTSAREAEELRARSRPAQGGEAAAGGEAARRRDRRRDANAGRRERDRAVESRAWTPTRCSTSPTASSSGTRPRRSCSAPARTAACTSSRTSTRRVGARSRRST